MTTPNEPTTEQATALNKEANRIHESFKTIVQRDWNLIYTKWLLTTHKNWKDGEQEVKLTDWSTIEGLIDSRSWNTTSPFRTCTHICCRIDVYQSDVGTVHSFTTYVDYLNPTVELGDTYTTNSK